MKKRPLFLLILFPILTTLACGLPGIATPTPEPSPIPTITLAPDGRAATAVPTETVTAVMPTETAAETKDPTPTPEATTKVTATATAATEGTAIPAPITAGEVFGPGMQDSQKLAGGDKQTYLIDGVKFMPRFIFAETNDEMDILLSVAENEANFASQGGAEVLVFTADDNGRYDLIIQNISETAGEYTIYLFDAAQPVPGAVHRPNITVAEGQSVQIEVESNGGRPLLIFVDPIDQSDVSVTATNDGQVVVDANYSGPGAAEAAFVLPLETTRYTITIKEINNAPAQINVLLVPLT
ncbi:MAG: hypothetical protein CSB13_03825 [Chloroflexi bacterium]|nr:MAG: hypothetical protein CSB13_03825 [Chloroflexota bacterium]